MGLAYQGGQYRQARLFALDPAHSGLAGEATVNQDVLRAHVLANRIQTGRELLFVVGRLADTGSGDQAKGGLHPGLRVVGLLDAVLGRHDAAFLVAEVLSGPFGRDRARAARAGGPGAFSLSPEALGGGTLFKVIGLFGHEAGVGSCLDPRPLPGPASPCALGGAGSPREWTGRLAAASRRLTRPWPSARQSPDPAPSAFARRGRGRPPRACSRWPKLSCRRWPR